MYDVIVVLIEMPLLMVKATNPVLLLVYYSIGLLRLQQLIDNVIDSLIAIHMFFVQMVKHEGRFASLININDNNNDMQIDVAVPVVNQ